MDPNNADRLMHLIECRHSSRAPFDPAQPVAPSELARIVEAARWAPTAHNMQNFRLIVVDDPRVLVELGAIRAPISLVFRSRRCASEMYSWKASWESSGVGM